MSGEVLCLESNLALLIPSLLDNSDTNPPVPESEAVSQCRVNLLQSHYFKYNTSSSGAEGLFKCMLNAQHSAPLYDIVYLK